MAITGNDVGGSITSEGSGSAALTPTTISDLFNAIDQAPEDFGQADAESALAKGDTEESSAYTTAEAIANANARLATVGGQVQQAQEGIQIRQTLGSQRAAVAAGGFQESGSALDLLRSSTQQGLLQQQITGINAQEQSAGYQEQGEAAAAEGAATTAAGSAATALAGTDQALGSAAKTNAVNEATALGVSIPGLGGLSATSIPTVNPVTIGSGAGGSGQIGGQSVSPANPFII